VYQILEEASVHRFIGRKEFDMVLEKLTGLDGTHKAGYFQCLGDVAEVWNKTGSSALEEPFIGCFPLRHFDGTVDLYIVRREKDKERNQSLVPHKPVALSLLVVSKAGSLTKVDDRAAVHA
jgi:hypothetical protein